MLPNFFANNFAIGYCNPNYKDKEIFIAIFREYNIGSEIFTFFLFKNYTDYYDEREKKYINKIFESIDYLESKGWKIMSTNETITTIENLSMYYPCLNKFNTDTTRSLLQETSNKLCNLKHYISNKVNCTDITDIIFKYIGNIIKCI